MEHMIKIRDTLLSLVCDQLDELDNVCAEELGEVVDMIKDMEEAMYYHTITKAMQKENGNVATIKPPQMMP